MRGHWYNHQDVKLYEELTQKKWEELTQEEKDFCINMYHQEEFYAYGEL